MFKALVFVCVLAYLQANVEGSLSLRSLLRRTTTEQPPTTTTPTIFINNNIPKVDEHCKMTFTCKKRMKEAPVPKPCLKFCVQFIECENSPKVRGKADQCVELDEAAVAEDMANGNKQNNGHVDIAPVAMIDFPCQPGYLPDYRGRCRQVW